MLFRAQPVHIIIFPIFAFRGEIMLRDERHSESLDPLSYLNLLGLSTKGS